MTISYYDILNIPDDATCQEIKDAYRTLSKQHHPDNNGDREEFESITRAYKVLSNPKERATYDEYGVDSDEIAKRINSAIGCFKEAVRRDSNNILENIKKLQKESIKELNNQIDDVNKTILIKNELLNRIILKPEKDFIGDYLRKEIHNMVLQIDMLNNAIDGVNSLSELFSSYEFKVNETPETKWNLSGIKYSDLYGGRF